MIGAHRGQSHYGRYGRNDYCDKLVIAHIYISRLKARNLKLSNSLYLSGDSQSHHMLKVVLFIRSLDKEEYLMIILG